MMPCIAGSLLKLATKSRSSFSSQFSGNRATDASMPTYFGTNLWASHLREDETQRPLRSARREATRALREVVSSGALSFSALRALHDERMDKNKSGKRAINAIADAPPLSFLIKLRFWEKPISEKKAKIFSTALPIRLGHKVVVKKSIYHCDFIFLWFFFIETILLIF